MTISLLRMDVNGTMDEALPDGEDKGLTPVLLATRLLENSAVKMLASNEWGNPWGLSVTQVEPHPVHIPTMYDFHTCLLPKP